jgi:hypothetical protein
MGDETEPLDIMDVGESWTDNTVAQFGIGLVASLCFMALGGLLLGTVATVLIAPLIVFPEASSAVFGTASMGEQEQQGLHLAGFLVALAFDAGAVLVLFGIIDDATA